MVTFRIVLPPQATLPTRFSGLCPTLRIGSTPGERGSGIDRFQESGFLTLCEPYRRGILKPEVLSLAEARSRLEETRRELLAGNMRIVCATDGESWKWTLKGKVVVPEGIEIHMWPITLAEERAQLLQLPSEWSLPTAYLTAFVAFRLRASGVELDDLRLTLKLPAEGMPESRLAQVLRTLIDSPERFLRFLRALLGGLDSLIAWSAGDGEGQQGRWGAGLGGETLLEDLVRVASRDPARLDPVRRLIADLRETEEGRQIVPDDLYAMWRVVDEAIRPQETR